MGDTVDEAEASQCPSDLIEIDIKRLHSETYTLRVDRNISIVELKERIADISGVTSGLQLLMFRGGLLKDDQFLSDYHVEGGHILYLVIRRPIPRLLQSPSSNAASDPILSRVDSQRRVIPDALTFVSANLNHLRRNNSQTSRNSMGNEQDSGPTRDNQIPRPSLLDRVQQTRRQLLVGEVAECLSNISMLLADQANLRDPSSQRLRQEIGFLSDLGNSLVHLGRVASRMGMGEVPEISVVRRVQLEIPLQTSNGAGNVQLATAPRNAVIRRESIVRILWRSPTEAEVEDSDSDSDSEDEMVKTVTTSLDIYSKERDGWSFFASERLFLGVMTQSEGN